MHGRYDSIITAVSPPPDAPDWVFASTLRALRLTSREGLAAGTARKAGLAVGAGMWYRDHKTK